MPREQFQKRILEISLGIYMPKKNEPKIWFASIKSLSEVLSENNLRLLAIINKEHPQSINHLAKITQRKASNLSRTLKTMARYGIVEFKKSGRYAMPIAKAMNFSIQYNYLSY